MTMENSTIQGTCSWCYSAEPQHTKFLHRHKNKLLAICLDCMNLMLECLDEQENVGCVFSERELFKINLIAGSEQMSLNDLLKTATLEYLENHNDDPPIVISDDPIVSRG